MIQQVRDNCLPISRKLSVYFFVAALGLLLCGCAPKRVSPPPQVPGTAAEEARKDAPPPKVSYTGNVWGPGLTRRIITEKEIEGITKRNPDLTRRMCLEILGRLNSKSHFHIPDDIKRKQKLRVPRDFAAYKDWTPMPKGIFEAAEVPKFILIVKDIPFIGWYEKGRLVGDAQVSIGKLPHWTKEGIYKVEEKDADHYSMSYKNVYGQPAPMPFALRIYGHVWIHGGDILGGYLSHGCINLPLDPSEQLFNWAEIGTVVLIVDSLKKLEKDLQKYSRTLLAKSPAAAGKKPVSRPSPRDAKP